jgi:hypothetical protein
MPLLRYLQHWLTGRGPCLQVADFVPATHPIRQWADTFPWAALVTALERSFAQRFPRPEFAVARYTDQYMMINP